VTEHFPRVVRLDENDLSAESASANKASTALWDQWAKLAAGGGQKTSDGMVTSADVQTGQPVQTKSDSPTEQPRLGQPSLEQLESAFEQEHKLKITSENGKFSYSMQYGGSIHKLFDTSADKPGLVNAEAKLKGLVAAEEHSLTSTYNVTFAKQGEIVDAQRESADSPPLAHNVAARDPELFELEGIRAALEKSGPSNIDSDGKTGVKYYCLTEKPILGIDSYATFQPDKDNKASVYLWPKFTEIDIATEKDRPVTANKPFSDGSRPESVEGAMIHELGHHQFMKLGFDPKHSNNEAASTAAEAALFKQMGWVRRLDEKDSDYNWLMVGKATDANGQAATYLPEFTGMFFSFGRWAQKGGPTDQAGHTVPADKMQRLGEDEMVKQAKVTPPTWYFENPEEEYAEAVRMFRMSSESRQYLHNQSPVLFDLMKVEDQKEINMLYGTNPDGTPKKIRKDSGEIVDR
jgi:hypothetical protein